MPNHITNRISVSGEEKRVKEFFDFIKGENGAIDFNKIVPMPKCLDIESSSDGDIGMSILNGEDKWKERFEGFDEERKSECLKLGRKYLNNIKKYKHKDWYSWRIANWGTKWNAYDISVSEDLSDIIFNTAWSGVPTLVEKLAKKFADLYIEYDFADEDCGYNTGRGETDGDGHLMMYYPDGGTDESWEIYFDLNPGAEELFENVDGEWRLKGEE